MGKVRSSRASFQLSSALSSSHFLRELVKLKASPLFHLRADERMGQSPSAAGCFCLFTAFYWAHDDLVLLVEP